MAGPDRRDPHSVALLDVPPPSSPRIAVSPRLGLGVAVDPDVMAAFDAAVATAARAPAGAIEEADVAWPDETTETAFARREQFGLRPALWRATSCRQGSVRRQHHRTDRAWPLVPGTDVVAAFRFADACARSVAQFFTEYDYLLTPTTACVSWPVEQVYPKVIENKEVGPRGHAAFTPLFNLALVPGISDPVRHWSRRPAGRPADRGAAPARPAVAGDGAARGTARSPEARARATGTGMAGFASRQFERAGSGWASW